MISFNDLNQTTGKCSYGECAKICEITPETKSKEYIKFLESELTFFKDKVMQPKTVNKHFVKLPDKNLKLKFY